MEGESVLWVDDYIGSFNSQVVGLERRGYRVRPEISLNEYASEFAVDFNNIIVDNKFGDHGTNDGRNFLEEILDTQTNKRVVVFSAYLEDEDLEKVVEKFEDTLNSVLFLSKNMPRMSDRAKDTRSFIEKVDKFFSSPFELLSADMFVDEDAPSSADEVDSYLEYLATPRSVQKTIRQELSRRYQSRADAVFNAGASWVLFFSGQADAHSSSLSKDVEPSRDQVDELARKYDRIPVVFVSALPVEDMSCAARCGIGDFESYPKAEIQFAEKDGPTVYLHYDTGSDYWFLNEKLVNEIGKAEMTDDMRTIKINGVNFFCERVYWNIGAVSRADENFHVYRGKLDAFSVSDWEEMPLMKWCSAKCTRGIDDRKCIFRRNGLLGRSFGRHLKIFVTLDPDDPVLVFHRRR